MEYKFLNIFLHFTILKGNQQNVYQQRDKINYKYMYAMGESIIELLNGMYFQILQALGVDLLSSVR